VTIGCSGGACGGGETIVPGVSGGGGGEGGGGEGEGGGGEGEGGGGDGGAEGGVEGGIIRMNW
jgi:hypothetical protein